MPSRPPSDRADIAEAERNLKQHLQEFTNSWNILLGVLALDVGAAFDGAGEALDIATIVNRAELWATELDRIDEWFRLTASEEECRRLELWAVGRAPGVGAPQAGTRA